MRVVFIGTVEFSLSALEKLVSMGTNIVGICTMKESTLNSDHVDLRWAGEDYGIPYYYVDDINSAKTLEWIRNKEPDIIFCFGWSKLIKNKLLTLAPMGIVGFHPTALPANRGRHPINWALVLGLDKTASTFFYMDEGADSGDIISQCPVLISEQDDARTLYDKLTGVALSQLKEFVPLLERGAAKRIKQCESKSNTWRKRERTDGLIDWRMSSHSIHNLVRGLTRPYVGASFLQDGKEIKVWKTLICSNAEYNIEAGKVLEISKDGPIIKCGEGAICLVETDPPFIPKVGDYI